MCSRAVEYNNNNGKARRHWSDFNTFLAHSLLIIVLYLFLSSGRLLMPLKCMAFLHMCVCFRNRECIMRGNHIRTLCEQLGNNNKKRPKTDQNKNRWLNKNNNNDINGTITRANNEQWATSDGRPFYFSHFVWVCVQIRDSAKNRMLPLIDSYIIRGLACL